MPGAYPLAWPAGWHRTAPAARRPSAYHFGQSSRRYQQGAAEEPAKQELLSQLRRLGAQQVVISTDIPLRRDGLPYSGRPTPKDPGVAVYFTRRGEERCIPCDRWLRIADNMYAIARTIDALRQLDRDGTPGMVDAAFRGFKALPPPGGTSGSSWWTVLKIEPDATREQVEAAFRALARKRHPDVTDDLQPWLELQDAYNQAKNATGGQ